MSFDPSPVFVASESLAALRSLELISELDRLERGHGNGWFYIRGQ